MDNLNPSKTQHILEHINNLGTNRAMDREIIREPLSCASGGAPDPRAPVFQAPNSHSVARGNTSDAGTVLKGAGAESAQCSGIVRALGF